MAKRAEQLNFLAPEPAKGNIIQTALHTEMQQSYLEYAMSVIVGRALPDGRDGLKPVHRRILFAMHELGLVPDRPYRKCARIVGDVLGKYHPHGDQSVYEALVRLVQDFSSRYPLLAGHGNFGSVDNDPPAAMRYTECRLAPIGNEALLGDLNDAVIDFTDNFDGSQQEPTVLPAQLPMLLLNGASGIAVGMATNIPPHNLREVVDGMIALIDQPNLPDEKLFELIPAPDFPTGGIIIDDAGIKEAYTTGRGSITVRGVASLETVSTGNTNTGKAKKSRTALIITELPFQVNKAAWIEKVAELVNQDKLDGIADLRDESDRTGMRVVIELKKETNPDLLLEKLYRQTALQVNFGAIMLALDQAQPKQMTLRQLLQQFISFREETLTRRYQHERNQAQQRLHLVEGFVGVLSKIDALIRLLRSAADTAVAKEQLQTKFKLSEVQAEAILAMPLRRLTGMEQQNLQTEMEELRQQIAGLEVLLGDRRELLKSLKKDLRALKKKHGDDRRSQILKLENIPRASTTETITKPKSSPKNQETREDISEAENLITAPTTIPKSAIVQVTHKGYVKRFDGDKFTSNGSAPKNLGDDVTVASYSTQTDRDLLVFTEGGKAYPVAVENIPEVSTNKNAKGRGTPLITLMPDSAEQIVSHLTWDKNPETTDSLVMITAQAKIKRSPLAELAGINNRGLTVAKFKDSDRLFWAGVVDANKQVVIATSTGRILRMATDEEQIPTLGRTAIGNPALRLRQTENLVGPVILDILQIPDPELLLVTAQGLAKRIKSSSIRLSPRGSIGSQAISFANKNDFLVGMVGIDARQIAQQTITLLIKRSQDEQIRTLQLAVSEIALETNKSQGQSMVELAKELNKTEQVVGIAIT